MSESVVLCEGYHDRAFWSGWLERLGCKNLAPPSGKKVLDPWGAAVVGGQYAFHSTTGRFIRLVPCHGRTNVLPEARNRLRQQRDDIEQKTSEVRLARLVVAIDPDTDAAVAGAKTGLRVSDLMAVVRHFDPAAAQGTDGDVILFGGAMTVSLVRWETPDKPAAGLPAQQTLERLVCAAVLAAHPDRGPAVQRWLDGRPAAPAAGPKEFGWSHMAGWYAEWGCEAFFRAVWDDERVAVELESRLRASGAWPIGQALAE